MSTLHKFKQYFGMVPIDEYEDEYFDDAAPRRSVRVRDDRDDYLDRDDAGYDAPAFRGAPARRDDFDEDRYDRPTRGDIGRRAEPISARAGRGAAGGSRPVSRGALAMDHDPRASLFDEAGALSKITTLRPRGFEEAITIGERFRDGSPVIMDLVEMSNADARRLVDFAAGLAFALHGSCDKVATKVFLLSPADIDVTAEEKRRIAETGFYQ